MALDPYLGFPGLVSPACPGVTRVVWANSSVQQCGAAAIVEVAAALSDDEDAAVVSAYRFRILIENAACADLATTGCERSTVKVAD